jgi:alpha/beta superfamily hydrolase
MGPLCSAEDPIVELVHFWAGPYRLEGELAYAEAAEVHGVALLAGPHPFLGGDMHNNVVRRLGDGLAERGIATLRFNYRGVGASQGPAIDVAGQLAQFWQTSRVAGEPDLAQDAAAAAVFLRTSVAEALPVALLGYSFGCTLLPQLAASDPAVPLVLVAPTIGKHDYTTFETLPNPLLVIAPADDFAADAGRVRQWFDRLSAPKLLHQELRDSHFFRGHEAWLAETVIAFLQEHWRRKP